MQIGIKRTVPEIAAYLPLSFKSQNFTYLNEKKID